MMFIGYPANRESDSVCMWDLTKNGFLTTCDVNWMKWMYFTQPKVAAFDVESIKFNVFTVAPHNELPSDAKVCL